MRPRDDSVTPLCPSAPPTWEGSVVFGVVQGTAERPEIGYLNRTLPATEEITDLAAPASPTEVFRFAAPCAAGGCGHFKESRCQLVERLVEVLPDAASGLPPCHIRQSCRWFLQKGKVACVKCPQITTDAAPSPALLYATGATERAPERRVVRLPVLA